MDAVSYNLPGTSAEYLPDPSEPIDGWLQMPNASNIRTTAKILARFGLGGVDALVDPFAGGGSTAMAARLMGTPFFGMELDPVLVCVSIVKSLLGTKHADWLRPFNGRTGHLAACIDVLLEALAQTKDTVSQEAMAADLAVAAPVADARLVWGDCVTGAAWDLLAVRGRRHVAVYTSPPFGSASPRLDVTAELRTRAAEVLRSAGLAATAPEFGPFAEFVPLTVSMLRNVTARVPLVDFIIEHEPDDNGADRRSELVEALLAEFGSITGLRVLECQAFSWRGPFSLIIGRLEA